jgi:hypothetical protein
MRVTTRTLRDYSGAPGVEVKSTTMGSGFAPPPLLQTQLKQLEASDVQSRAHVVGPHGGVLRLNPAHSQYVQPAADEAGSAVISNDPE